MSTTKPKLLQTIESVKAEIHSTILKIANYALVNSRENFQINFQVHGHTKSIDLTVFENGWDVSFNNPTNLGTPLYFEPFEYHSNKLTHWLEIRSQICNVLKRLEALDKKHKQQVTA